MGKKKTNSSNPRVLAASNAAMAMDGVKQVGEEGGFKHTQKPLIETAEAKPSISSNPRALAASNGAVAMDAIKQLGEEGGFKHTQNCKAEKGTIPTCSCMGAAKTATTMAESGFGGTDVLVVVEANTTTDKHDAAQEAPLLGLGLGQNDEQGKSSTSITLGTDVGVTDNEIVVPKATIKTRNTDKPRNLSKKNWGRSRRYKDPKEPTIGYKLSFNPSGITRDINGNRVGVTLTEEDLEENELTMYSLVGKFAEEHPGKKAVQRLVNRWPERCKFIQHKSGWSIFTFKDTCAMDNVLLGGPYSVDDRPLLLKKMPKFFAFGEDE